VAKRKKSKEADSEQQAARRSRTPGRLLSALSVLLGQRVTPVQIEAEWVEYKAIFSDLLSRHGAMLARHAKAEKERLDRTFDQLNPPQVTESPVVGQKSEKDRLRSQVAAGRFGLRAAMPRGQGEVPGPPPPLEEVG